MASLLTKQVHRDTELCELQRDRYGAIILCGGKGTRMFPLTGDKTPKSLYSVDGRELISYSLDLLAKSRVDRVVFVLKHQSDQMEKWICSSDIPYEHISLKTEKETMAGAIAESIPIADRDQLVICNGDEIIRNFNLEDMLREHERTGSQLTILATDRNNAVGGGVLVGTDGPRVTRIVEKSKPGSESTGLLFHAGIIVIKREALQHLHLEETEQKSGVVDMPIMRGGLSAGILNAYIDRNVVFFNINSPEDAENAAKYLARSQTPPALLINPSKTPDFMVRSR